MATTSTLGLTILEGTDAPDFVTHVAAQLQRLNDLLDGTLTHASFNPKFTTAFATVFRPRTAGGIIQAYDAASNMVYDGGAGANRITYFEGPAGTSTTEIHIGKTGDTTATLILINATTVRLAAPPAFVASDKYLVIDSSGNIHVSALGPAS